MLRWHMQGASRVRVQGVHHLPNPKKAFFVFALTHGAIPKRCTVSLEKPWIPPPDMTCYRF